MKNINKIFETQFSSPFASAAAPIGSTPPIHINIMNKKPLHKRLLTGAGLIGTGMALGKLYLAKNVGKHNDIPDSEFDSKQLEMGIKVEKEHTNNPEVAKDIAKDHLKEIPDYYTRLKKMESGAKHGPERD